MDLILNNGTITEILSKVWEKKDFLLREGAQTYIRKVKV
jgi:hypothetical protein